MPTTVEVRFKGNRKDYFLWPEDAEPLHLNDPVVVEAERGLDLGRVTVLGDRAATKCAAGCGCSATASAGTAARNVVRVASPDEVRNGNALRRSEEGTRIKAIERVRHHQLEMKVSDCEWQWDRKKLTFYFTAETRVDFRNLVRDLATTFKTRIDLRQVGARDEAARLGGVGRCGKEYCCSSWLRELSPVSLSLAKDQHLSLNPGQISGGCGRLLCCLKYEHEFYVTTRKRFPKEGKTVVTARGPEKVAAVDIFRERVSLRSDEHGPRVVLLADLTDEIAQAATGARTEIRITAPPPPPAPPAPDQRRPERRPTRAPEPKAAAAPTVPPAEPDPAQPAAAEPAPGKRHRPKRRRRRRGSRPDQGGPPPSDS